jgi:hypothetical protein
MLRCLSACVFVSRDPCACACLTYTATRQEKQLMIRKLFRAALLTLMLMLVACGGGTPAASNHPTATPSGGTESKPAASKPIVESDPTEAPAPSMAAEPTPPAVSIDGESRDVQDISGSLDGLSSYRLHFRFTFDGKDEQGKPQKGAMEWLQEAIKETKESHIRFTSTGDAAQENGKPGAFEMYQVGASSYIYSPDGQADQKCMGITSDQNGQNGSAFFKPGDMVGGLKQAQLVGKGETINGVVADHYSFDQNAVSFGNFEEAKGDIWIAQDGGYPVKYIGTARGKDTILAGKTAEGTFTWEYKVEDANQVESIKLPQECESQKPADDIPVPESATEKNSFGKLITFKSSDAPADIAAFYQKELPDQGWAAGDASALDDLQTLSFTKAGRKLSITITKEESGGSNVLINEEQGS